MNALHLRFGMKFFIPSKIHSGQSSSPLETRHIGGPRDLNLLVEEPTNTVRPKEYGIVPAKYPGTGEDGFLALYGKQEVSDFIVGYNTAALIQKSHYPGTENKLNFPQAFVSAIAGQAIRLDA